MREIKFRAWDEERKEMTYLEGKAHVTLSGTGASKSYPYYCMPATSEVMQYAGLKDKNGKGADVYHQDILKLGDGYSGDHFEKGGNYTVEWIDDGWVIVDKDGEYFCSLFEGIYNRGAKVIGNIWENGDLIK